MDTKRLSELKAPENIESAHVLGEENGKYVKFPARELGKVKSVNGTAPDENGNVAVPIPESITPPAAAAAARDISASRKRSLSTFLPASTERRARRWDIGLSARQRPSPSIASSRACSWRTPPIMWASSPCSPS